MRHELPGQHGRKMPFTTVSHFPPVSSITEIFEIKQISIACSDHSNISGGSIYNLGLLWFDDFALFMSYFNRNEYKQKVGSR